MVWCGAAVVAREIENVVYDAATEKVNEQAKIGMKSKAGQLLPILPMNKCKLNVMLGLCVLQPLVSSFISEKERKSTAEILMNRWCRSSYLCPVNWVFVVAVFSSWAIVIVERHGIQASHNIVRIIVHKHTTSCVAQKRTETI